MTVVKLLPFAFFGYVQISIDCRACEMCRRASGFGALMCLGVDCSAPVIKLGCVIISTKKLQLWFGQIVKSGLIRIC